MESLAEIWNLYDLLERERPPLEHQRTYREGILLGFRVARNNRLTWTAPPGGELISLAPDRVDAFDIYNYGNEADFAIKRTSGGFLLFTASQPMDIQVHANSGPIYWHLCPGTPLQV